MIDETASHHNYAIRVKDLPPDLRSPAVWLQLENSQIGDDDKREKFDQFFFTDEEDAMEHMSVSVTWDAVESVADFQRTHNFDVMTLVMYCS